MTYETISYELDSGVAKIVLNRPDRLNAFTAAMYDEMLDLLNRIAHDEAARAVLITGAGRAFSAGQDLLDEGGARARQAGDEVVAGSHVGAPDGRAVRQ